MATVIIWDMLEVDKKVKEWYKEKTIDQKTLFQSSKMLIISINNLF